MSLLAELDERLTAVEIKVGIRKPEPPEPVAVAAPGAPAVSVSDFAALANAVNQMSVVVQQLAAAKPAVPGA